MGGRGAKQKRGRVKGREGGAGKGGGGRAVRCGTGGGRPGRSLDCVMPLRGRSSTTSCSWARTGDWCGRISSLSRRRPGRPLLWSDCPAALSVAAIASTASRDSRQPVMLPLAHFRSSDRATNRAPPVPRTAWASNWSSPPISTPGGSLAAISSIPPSSFRHLAHGFGPPQVRPPIRAGQ